MDLAVPDFTSGDPGAKSNVHALLLELPGGFLGDLLISHRKKIMQRFEQHHFRPKPTPDTAQFQPDDSRTDHAQAFGYLIEFKGPCRVDNHAIDQWARGYFHRHGPRRQDDIPGFQGLCLATVRRKLHFPGAVEPRLAFEGGHTIALEQTCNTLGQTGNDRGFSLHHHPHINADVPDDNTNVGERVACLGIFVRGF